jgi:RNA polymerase sigma-70 factor (ECF subfamily)
MSKEEFEPLLYRYEKKLYRYIYKIVNDHDTASDILQSVFVSFYIRIDRIDSETAGAYLYKTAYNKSLYYFRYLKKHIVFDPVDIEKYVVSRTDYEMENFEGLNQALRSLPLKLYAVIQLKYYENMSYKDIASELGTTVKAIESLLVRARKALRDTMRNTEMKTKTADQSARKVHADQVTKVVRGNQLAYC